MNTTDSDKIEQEKRQENKKFRKLIHDIRNMLKLTDENISYIETLDDKEKMEVIIEYDRVLQGLVEIMYSGM